MPGSEPQVRKDSRLFAEMCSAVLRRGHSIQFRVNGASMSPNLLDGDDVVVVPAGASDIHQGDVVLAENLDGLRVHRVSSCASSSESTVLRSDTGLDFDPPASRIFGKVALRNRGHHQQSFTKLRTRFVHPLRILARRVRLAAQNRLRRFAFLLGTIGSLLFVSAALAPPVHAQTADLSLTQTASSSAVDTNATTQSLGTATTVIWSGGSAIFTFPTPLPSGANPNVLLTTTGFTPAIYNVTNASITSVNYAAGTVTIALPSQSMGTATAATWSSAGGGTASFTFPTPLPSEAVVGAQLTTTAFTPAAYNVTNATITSVNSGTGLVTVSLAGQSFSGNATAATWSSAGGGTASFTFPTPLPSYAVVGAPLTTTGFTPSSYNVTNATITAIASGVLSVALPPQSLGGATSASWTGGVSTYVFPTPLPSNVVVGAPLTTTGFKPNAYNVTNVAIASVNNATGVVTVAHAASIGANTQLGTGTAGPITATTDGPGTVGPLPATTNGTGTVNPGTSTTNGIGTVPTGYTYSEVVTNNSSSATVTSGTITVYMQTPANTVFEAAVGTNWSCTAPTAGNTGPIVCTYNTTLNSGATASTLTLAFQVASGTAYGTTIQSSATVTNSTFVDTTPSNNTSITSMVVEPSNASDLALSMSVSPTPVFISSTLAYTIQVQNLGQASAPATTNVLTDTLPAGLTNVSVSAPAGWSCSGAATVSCSITSAMASGTAATITISASTPSSATTLSNTATVNLPGDPNSANNSATSYTVVQPIACATPGRDGAGGTLTGIVNTYYRPANSGTLASGSTSVVLAAADPGGAQKPIAVGDLVLIIQMQAATINSTNTSSYGHGVPGDPAAGYTSLGSSGLFEFVTATSAVPLGGGTLTFTATGPTGGLLNSYSLVAATNAVAQQTYQAIRVPQYASATLSSGLVPLAWYGSCVPGNNCGLTYAVGGVLAVDVSSQLTLGGTVSLDALGFRGGAGQLLTGPSVGGTNTPSDYVTGAPASNTATAGANGSKGEGIAGTPRYVPPSTIALTSRPTDVYGGTLTDSLPNGSSARGAPGNAGGGGTDGDPPANDFNSGGGAGGNGGTGGQGGYGWNSMASTNTTDGGFGGAAFPASTSALVMGGGGGAGTTNNGSYFISGTNHNANCGANCTGIYSSGGAGGGIVIIHAGSVVGTGTISANGQSTLSTDNDSTGGAGAGGSILFFANSGGLGGLTVSANGGSAGNAWPETAPGGFPGQRHGPGGGAGGGIIFLTGSPASSSVLGGANGYTNTVQDSYGSTPGAAGLVGSAHLITETPGTQSGAYCGSADLSVTNAGAPAVQQPGLQIAYTQTVTNNGPLDAVNAVFSEGIPANTTFVSINSAAATAAGWTCTTPAVGGTGDITCTNPDFANAGTFAFNVVVQIAAGTASGTEIIDVDHIISGTSDPNLNNNTATAVTTVSSSTEADLAITNTASSPTVVPGTGPGTGVTMTAVVTNNGPGPATGNVFTETIPANTTLGAAFTPPSGWSCNTIPVGGTGTFNCNNSSFVALASSTFAIVLSVNAGTAPGTIISDTASIGSATPDPNTGNNSATATSIVANANQADLAVTSSGTPNPVTDGNNITYTQSITNNGPAAITISGSTSVTFTDTIPANTTLGSAFTAPANWTCSAIPVGGTGTMTCTLNSGQTLAVGAVVNFPLVVKVNAGTAPGTTITNTANISSTVSDPYPANNTATVNTVVASPTQSSVTITKTASPEPVDQGTTLTYTITVSNGGPAAATGNFTVTDALPPEVTYIPNAYSTTAVGGSCSGTTTVTCNIGSLAVGSTVVVTINVTATTFSASSLSTNTATLTTNTTVPNAPVSLGTAAAASWSGGVASYTFPTPLPLSLSTSSTLTTNGFAPSGYNLTNAAIQSINTATGVITVAMTTNPGSETTLGSGTASIPYPLIAQSVSTIQAPTAVDISSIHAFSQPDGSIRLVWRTQEESRNLGFHIYREDASGRHRVDTSLIAGSALLLRGSRPQHAAKSYAWIDTQPALNASYWIEDVDINGTRSVHGPAYPEFASSSVSEQAQAFEATAASPSLRQLRSNALPVATGARPNTYRFPPLPAPPVNTPRVSVADHVAVKILVDQEGWYHIPFAQLFAAGLDPNTDLRSLRLYAEGIEQPLLLVGHTAGIASPSDSLEFYGTGIDTPFSGTRVYWLTRDGFYPKRILPVPTPSYGVTGPASFSFTIIRQDRTTYFAALLNGENNDNFFGDVITSAPVDETLAVVHRDTSSSQSLALDLTLQGVTDAQQHSVSVQFNGTGVGTYNSYGQALVTQAFSVDPSLLLDGTNTVTLTALNGDNDVSVVQSVKLHYLHTYTADAGWLRATADAGSDVQITGFSNPQIRVFDITDPLNISQLAGNVTLQSGSYAVSVALPIGSPYQRTLLAFSEDTVSAPSTLQLHVPTFLDDNRSGADIVIISHPDFTAHLAPLVRLRESQGYRVSVVTTDQIFDEFNFGERSPFAIRSFLQNAAAQWYRKPQAVLLVGDASLDPRNYLGFGDFDFVPTRIIETAAFKTASDDWFSDFRQNGYATIPTGRLPVRTTSDVDLLVSKIINYEQGQSSGTWNSQALLVADQNVDANFSAAVSSAVAALPKSLQASQILANDLDPATARSQILTALNNGALLVDYNGHGAEQQWSFLDLFNNNDATALSNGNQLPVYLLMDCLNGLFQDVYAQSLAKALILAPNGGAVAVWASSGFTDQAPQVSMNLAFLHQLATRPNDPLGRLALHAKAGITDRDVRRTWILFGDPATRFHFAVSPSTATSNSTIGSTPSGGSARLCPNHIVCVKEGYLQ